jgi:hypothetical protein
LTTVDARVILLFGVWMIFSFSPPVLRITQMTSSVHKLLWLLYCVAGTVKGKVQRLSKYYGILGRECIPVLRRK